jgi:two-component system, sensor histidine kinase and response regulator
VVDLLSATAEAKRIRIKCTRTANLTAFADADMLKTILRNLISNAIKFTGVNGVITIKAEDNDGEVTIGICDTGVGISAENLGKLFDVARVYSTPGTAKEKGTGLGLLLCKEFVEMHGGRIWVSSEPGRGSLFSFTLPAIGAPQASPGN